MGFFAELGNVIDNIVEGLVILFGDDQHQTNADDEVRRASAEQR